MRRLVNQAGKEVMPYLFLIQQADILSQSDYRREEKEHRLQMAKQDYEKVCAQGEAGLLKELHGTGNESRTGTWKNVTAIDGCRIGKSG